MTSKATDNMPILTVCITTYNRWSLCGRALESVLRQEGVDVEVILVDDHSNQPMPDEIRELIESYGVRYIRHEKNSGLAEARTTAIQAAQGYYFSFCDDDDMWPQGFAQHLVYTAEHAPDDVEVVLGFSAETKKRCGPFFAAYPTLQEVMKSGVTPPVGGQLYRSHLVKSVGGYDKRVASGVDHDLWISLAENNPRVAACWGEPVIVGSAPQRSRMTTAEKHRREGIAKSLSLWRPRLVKVFGEDFYHHFCRSYRQSMDIRFFIESYRRGCYARTVRKALSVYMLRILLIRVLKRLRRACNLFPQYRDRASKGV